MNNNFVNCNNVYVRSSTVCDGFGAFARKQFTKGEGKKDDKDGDKKESEWERRKHEGGGHGSNNRY